MKKLAVFLVAVAAGLALSSPIHTWTAGEYITQTDLNAALTHLHNSVGHGHGPILVNADVSASAAIAHSKLATPALLPKAWVTLTASCGASPCVTVDSSVVTSVTRTSAGVYVVNFPTRGDTTYGALSTAYGNLLINCGITAKAATNATVTCVTGTTGAATDGAFTFMLLDSSN